MSDDGDKLPYGLGVIVKSYGLGGLILILGIALIGVTIYKGSSFAAGTSQLTALVGGGIIGLLLVAAGVAILWIAPKTTRPTQYDVYIAAPMAGFDEDEDGRKAAVDLVLRAEAALKRLELKTIYTPVPVRPERIQYESASVGFDAEWAALRGSKRYLLILPPNLPAGTSVLVTLGIAIALNIPIGILANKGAALPYLVDGAAESKQVKACLHYYADLKGIDQVIENNRLGLFGSEATA